MRYISLTQNFFFANTQLFKFFAKVRLKVLMLSPPGLELLKTSPHSKYGFKLHIQSNYKFILYKNSLTLILNHMDRLDLNFPQGLIKLIALHFLDFLDHIHSSVDSAKHGVLP